MDAYLCLTCNTWDLSHKDLSWTLNVFFSVYLELWFAFPIFSSSLVICNIVFTNLVVFSATRKIEEMLSPIWIPLLIQQEENLLWLVLTATSYRSSLKIHLFSVYDVLIWYDRKESSCKTSNNKVLMLSPQCMLICLWHLFHFIDCLFLLLTFTFLMFTSYISCSGTSCPR